MPVSLMLWIIPDAYDYSSSCFGNPFEKHPSSNPFLHVVESLRNDRSKLERKEIPEVPFRTKKLLLLYYKLILLGNHHWDAAGNA
jgi:hypothetical protein